MSSTLGNRWEGVRNARMREKLVACRAIDVSTCRRVGDFYLLPSPLWIEGMDYCNASTEVWIWSIGRHRKTGKILASHGTNFYSHPSYECLWLR